MVAAYEDQFKDSILNILRKSHYGKDRSGTYPFIIDTRGVVILHPRLARGSTLLVDEASTQKMLALKTGSLNRVADGVFRHVNPAFEKTLGYTRDEMLAKPYHEFVHPDDKAATREAAEKLSAGVPTIKFENRYICKDGTYKWLEWTSMPDPAAGLSYTVARDITGAKKLATEKERMETLLQQAQKMEAIGTLAGGIAHDFNNLLMGILGTVSLLLSTIDATHPDYEKLHNIESYVHQATDLTRQLLGFARGGKYEVKSIDLNDLVSESSRLFGRTRKEVSIHLRLQPEIWAVEADKGQIDQVLLNLYVNAWQSMPDGGQFYISSENLSLDEDFVKPFDVKPGRYVKIALTDTGVGMDKAARQRIFEPFFTIDLVVLDMIMPDVSGGETFDRLKTIKKNVKVLLSSGYSLEGKAAAIMERGCDGFIQKPFNLNQLAQKIRQALDCGNPAPPE